MSITPEQRRKNRKTGLIILAVVIAVFAWVFVRQTLLVG